MGKLKFYDTLLGGYHNLLKGYHTPIFGLKVRLGAEFVVEKVCILFRARFPGEKRPQRRKLGVFHAGKCNIFCIILYVNIKYIAMNSVVKMILITTCALSLSPSCTLAQKIFPNSFKISTGTFSIKDRNTLRSPFQQIGACYERKVYKHWYAGLGYYQWKRWRRDAGSRAFIVAEPWEVFLKREIGALNYRADYRIVDAYGSYKASLHKNHFINAGLGICYYWGYNTYLKEMLIYWPSDAQILYDYAKGKYWGIVPQVSYEYMCIKGRLNIGVDARARYFTDNVPAQYDLGVHAGVNF